MNKRIIVSTTTTKNRLKFLFYMLESLKKQSLQPDVIYLNISNESYLIDEGIDTLPEWISQNEKVKVNMVENTGPYRKLLPVFENDLASEDDLVITADDDVLYGEHWLEKLVAKSHEYPDSIICATGRSIKKNIFKKDQSYMNWWYVRQETQAYNVLPTGMGGVVYQKRLLDIAFLLNKAYMELAPTDDDLWFRQAYDDCSVVVVPDIDKESIYLEHGLGLSVNFNQNNKAYPNIYDPKDLIKKLPYYFVVKTMDYFGIATTNYDIQWKKVLKFRKNFNTAN